MNIRELFETVIKCNETGNYNSIKELEFEINEYFNWAEDIFEGLHLKNFPDKKALIWVSDEEERSYTFKDISELSNKLLNFLRKRNIKRGDGIFVMLPLLPEIWLSYLASIKGGYILVPAATILTIKDLEYRFKQFPPKVVIADFESANKIDQAEENTGQKSSLKILVKGNKEGWISFDEILKESSEAKAERTKLNDILFIFFTSGTTGLPKMVAHTHASYPIGHLTTSLWIGIRRNDIHYNISQPGWAKFAWSTFFAAWNIGATVFAYNYKGRFNAKRNLELIEKYKITTFCAPPTVWRQLILEDLKGYNFSLRECVSAGEPLNPEVIDKWKEKTGITIRDGYGQTETTLIVGNFPGMKVKYGSMGVPSFLNKILIVDDEGNELQPNTEGNIAISLFPKRPINIFAGYYGDEKKTSEVFRKNLYFTGDRAYKDEEGYFWFVGRGDDVIKSSDYRIGPFEVESVLIEHEAVAEAAAVASPHATKGFVVKAFITLKPGYKPSKELAISIFEYARKNLSHYKVPRVIEFVDDLPKTISGKIRRIELREREKIKKERSEREYFYDELFK